MATAICLRCPRIRGLGSGVNVARVSIRNLARGNSSLTILSHPEQYIAKLVMNSPKNRNALSLEMLTELVERVQEVVANKKNRVLIIGAEGPVFSSGHNLKELTADKGKEYHTKVFSACTKLMTSLQEVPLPVIAEVRGLATAAGCQLVASCDIVVAANTAQFATPGVNVGLFCSTPGVAVGRSLPRKIAMEMLFTGNPITAEKAYLHGLVSKVVPEEEVTDETMEIAQKICSVSPEVVCLGKACFYQQASMGLSQAYQLAEGVMVHNLALESGIEGLSAFIEKRKPIWPE